MLARRAPGAARRSAPAVRGTGRDERMPPGCPVAAAGDARVPALDTRCAMLCTAQAGDEAQGTAGAQTRHAARGACSRAAWRNAETAWCASGGWRAHAQARLAQPCCPLPRALTLGWSRRIYTRAWTLNLERAGGGGGLCASGEADGGGALLARDAHLVHGHRPPGARPGLLGRAARRAAGRHRLRRAQGACGAPASASVAGRARAAGGRLAASSLDRCLLGQRADIMLITYMKCA